MLRTLVLSYTNKMEYLLPFLIILNILPSPLRAEHYPDITCYQSYERHAMEPHEKACSKRIKNPLNRECYKACMLERLMIILPPDIYEPNLTEFSFISLEPENLEFALSELKNVLFNEMEAQDVAAKISQNCQNIMHQTINVEKKLCEQWDPIYDCIQEQLCAVQKMYPDMSCHDDFRSFPFLREQTTCTRRIALPTTKECMKGCLLSHLGIYVYDLDEEDPVPKMGNMEGEYAYYNLLYNFIDGLSGNRDLAERLVKNVNQKCSSIFNDVINVKKLQCDQWGDLYDCVEKALQCVDVSDNKPGGGAGGIEGPPGQGQAPPPMPPQQRRRRRRRSFY